MPESYIGPIFQQAKAANSYMGPYSRIGRAGVVH